LLPTPAICIETILDLKRLLAQAPRIAIDAHVLCNCGLTDIDPDNQATIMTSLLTSHGGTTPLVWLSVAKSTLKDN
jgi:hypothetical protein